MFPKTSRTRTIAKPDVPSWWDMTAVCPSYARPTTASDATNAANTVRNASIFPDSYTVSMTS